MDINGILPINTCIDIWKSIVLSVPKSRTSVENVIITFILPQNK